MIGKLNSQQLSVANQTNRNFAAVYTGGFGGLLNDILAALQGGATGITAAGVDIDSLALGGGAFTVDPDNTTGLTFAWTASRIRVAGGVVAVAAGSLTLAASLANYVEVDGGGAVSGNTTGFTAGRCPLYVVTTGTAAIATTVNAKALLSFVGPRVGRRRAADGRRRHPDGGQGRRHALGDRPRAGGRTRGRQALGRRPAGRRRGRRQRQRLLDVRPGQPRPGRRRDGPAARGRQTRPRRPAGRRSPRGWPTR